MLIIALDDLNNWLGCMGTNPDVQTPHMDHLAEHGTLFTNACCASPVCLPSRTALLTGLNPTTTGCYLLNDLPQDSPGAHEAPPFPLHFRHNGYRTMSVGKVDHGNLLDRAVQAERGESMWDEDGGRFGGQQFDMHSRHTSCLTETPGYYSFAYHWGPLDEDQAATMADRHVADWAVERLQHSYDSPFLLAAGFHRPHVPLIAPQRFFDMYDKEQLHLPPTGPYDFDGMPEAAQQVALTGYQETELGKHYQITQHGHWRDILQAYLACISFADECVGRVLSALEQGPHAGNTVVALWSDNGWNLGEHFHWQKFSLWDQSSRVPLIIRAPGMAQPGRPCHQGVSLVDLYPTLLELCNLPQVPGLEGESLQGLLCGERKKREHPAMTSFGPHNHSLRTERWRYTRYCDGSEELYDYETDLNEHTNLADSPECADIKGSLARWLPERTAPSLASTPPPAGPLSLRAGDQVWFRGMESGFHRMRITIRARVRAEEGEGVIVHHGSWFAGYSLYVKDGRLCMGVRDVRTPLRWDRLQATTTIARSDRPLPESLVAVEGCLDVDGTITLKVDGEPAGAGKAAGPLSVYPSGLLEAGRYTQTGFPPIGDYAEQKDFPGAVQNITVSFSR